MKRHYFLVFTGLETMAVGVLLLLQKHFFVDSHNNRMVHVIHHMGDPDWAVLLMVIGLVAVLIGATNLQRHGAQKIILIILGGLWFSYSLFFVMNDINSGQPLRLGTLLSCFIFLEIATEAYYGEEGGE